MFNNSTDDENDVMVTPFVFCLSLELAFLRNFKGNGRQKLDLNVIVKKIKATTIFNSLHLIS